VKLARLETRSGKQIALNNAVRVAQGEILLFTDASVILRSDAAKNLARNFADATVGAVSSVIHIRKVTKDGSSSNQVEKAREAEGAYLDLDLSIRRLESLVGSAVGCCGSCYAVRRSAFVDFAPSACNDFVSALDAVRLGFRCVMDDEAVGYMLPARSIAGEFRRKARTIAGGLETYWQSGRFAGLSRLTFLWQLLSHKVCRWLGPIALLVAGVAALVGGALGDVYLLILAVMGLFWVAAALLVVGVPELGRKVFPLKLANFAFVAWLAGLWAWVLFLRGKQQVTWQPTQR
jgi:cellulose synthase/poly-beta-1,6-N-acetylglucosamine synthase-like glycosyltransferase